VGGICVDVAALAAFSVAIGDGAGGDIERAVVEDSTTSADRTDDGAGDGAGAEIERAMVENCAAEAARRVGVRVVTAGPADRQAAEVDGRTHGHFECPRGGAGDVQYARAGALDR